MTPPTKSKPAPPAAGVTTYTFDAAGNQQLVNAAGELTTSTWDNENRNTVVQCAQRVVTNSI